MHFYPRSPCGERPRTTASAAPTTGFLSTLSLRRATRVLECTRNAHTDFYPRSPCGERRESQPPSVRPTKDFYPRSPCGERRLKISCTASASRDFYPRSPCGERHLRLYFKHPNVEFLSTLSLRRATHLCVCTCRAPTISIHALLAESDLHGLESFAQYVISIHALLAESDPS